MTLEKWEEVNGECEFALHSPHTKKLSLGMWECGGMRETQTLVVLCDGHRHAEAFRHLPG